MPGLNLRGSLSGVSARPQATTAPSPGTSVTSAAFGPGYTVPGRAKGSRAFVPNDAFGIGFWVGVAAIAGLVFIRQSLPR